MKPGTLLWVLLGLLLAAAAFVAAMALRPNLVVMADGSIRGADRVLEDDGALILLSGQTESRLAAEDVRCVLTGLPRSLQAAGLRLRFGMVRAQGLWQRAGRRGRVVLAAAGAIGLLGLLAVGFAGRRRKAVPTLPRPREPVVSGPKPVARSPRLVGLADVERFFLNLYRRQIGAAPGAPGRIEAVESAAGGPGRICQLSVKIGDEWRSRRMTLATIGEGTGSRSQCFYAIFDTHMVIKAPPTPVRDFEDYVQRIRYESALVARLSPRECLIPSLSVILGRIHRFGADEIGSTASLEERYIDLLRSAPEFRDCLRIGDAFVFFMDLSRHHFMSQALSGMNESQGLLAAVARNDAAPESDCHDFENRYGGDNGWVCPELQRLCRQFVGEARDVPGSASSVLPADKALRTFFYQEAAGVAEDAAEMEIRPETHPQLADLGRQILETAPEVGEAYGRMARAHAGSKRFARNRSRMEALTANLLDLLAWMGDRGVAMRDLKPDNLLVAGPAENYPLFLSSAGEFALGLIDLETACDLRSLDKGRASQPQLGGTPSYATPSHFFPNRVLSAVHDNLAGLLHYQDWHAVAAIVFETVTGRRLFGRTAGQIPRILAALNQAVAKKRSLDDLYREVGARFWEQAREEFDRMTAACQQRLDALRVHVPATLGEAMASVLDGERQRVQACFDALLDCQAPLSDDNREKLRACSSDRLRKLCEKYRVCGIDSRVRLAEGFGALADHRQQVEELAAMVREIPRRTGTATVGRLLALMHRTTAVVMATGTPAEASPVPVEIADVPAIDPRHTVTVVLAVEE